MAYSLDDTQKKILLALARKTVEDFVGGDKTPLPEISDEILLNKGAAFVTLHLDGNLRGCIGHVEAYLPLTECIKEMALAACSRDTRFNPVSVEELASLSYEITVLTPMQKVEDPKDIVVGRDGLMIEKGVYRGLLLPQVPLEWGWDREEFLSHTAEKAGLPADAWKDQDTIIYSFEGLVFGDDSD